MSHVSVYVLNQDSAFDFYVNKLGFKVHTDAPMGPGMRWLTVTPPLQPELEITLMPITEGMMFTKETAATMRELVKKGTFGFGVFEANVAAIRHAADRDENAVKNLFLLASVLRLERCADTVAFILY